jgi:hypothetical protein
MASHDFLLVALATTVIALACWPCGKPRQVVQFRDASGKLQPYSLAADDPRLAKLRTALARWSDPPCNAALATEKWRAEAAEFYARATAPLASPARVIPASYTGALTPAGELDHDLAAQHAHWKKTQAAAQQAIAEAQARIAHRQAMIGPPLVMANITDGGHSVTVIALSCLLGLIVAAAVAAWTYRAPALQLVGGAGQTSAIATREHSASEARLELVIPAAWIRIHQPPAVILRRLFVASIVITALVCAAR